MSEMPQVGEIDPTKQTSRIKDTDGSVIFEGNVETDEPTEGAQCWYNGVAHSTGARVCQLGKVKECDQWGEWQSTFDSC